ncbi:uroporphyrinogen decarboxylase [Bordetella pertussis]|nr:uroporphyrinogen decarboxylase [Bordetella pertussis]
MFNLGHGISQYSPPEVVSELVDEVHTYSRETPKTCLVVWKIYISS